MRTGYKLFRLDKSGNLHPLYILSKETIPIGVWLKSEVGPVCEDGKHVKGKMVLSLRSGWHVAGSKPEAPQIKEKRGEMVWCQVDIDDSKDCNDLAKLYGREQNGSTSPKMACFRRCPEGGWYFYRTSAKQTEPWIICDRMRVVKKLSWNEVDELRSA